MNKISIFIIVYSDQNFSGFRSKPAPVNKPQPNSAPYGTPVNSSASENHSKRMPNTTTNSQPKPQQQNQVCGNGWAKIQMCLHSGGKKNSSLKRTYDKNFPRGQLFCNKTNILCFES